MAFINQQSQSLRKSISSSSIFNSTSNSAVFGGKTLPFGTLAKSIGTQPSLLAPPKIDAPQANPLANIIRAVQAEVASLHSRINGQAIRLNQLHGVLTETTTILEDIGNALALDFANRIAEAKEAEEKLKLQISRKRFKEEESSIEQSSKRVGNIITATASKMMTPFRGIFDKILEFVGIIGAGIGTNVVFGWLTDEQNQRKMGKFFNILGKNWKWIAGTLGVLVAAKVTLDIIGLITTIGAALTALANPWVLTLLAFLGGGIAGQKRVDRLNEIREESGEITPNVIVTDEDGSNPRISYDPEDVGNADTGGTWWGNFWNTVIRAWEDAITREGMGQMFNKGGYTGETGGIVHPHEFVLRPAITQKIGISRLERINRGEGFLSDFGTNNIIPIDLPAITAKMPEVDQSSGSANDVPNVASSNGADPYRHLTPSIYGIFV